ncbi:helix-turn-helix domain-containing protein [Staphylococcus ureilyticus]|uniref:helix-turn-helix domain-containing protein n=1 Tax=Staphylococcus ureilyticus TaxID=94138 RepID=UPI0021D1B3EC|nr:helix-turn-helix transcriptional regulator [Staphylococcus ureilyticus]UXS61009.1 helix-turn-helix domain-containing protein [Staphylococcus ureilyticus]
MNNRNLGQYLMGLRENVSVSNRQLSIDASMSRTYLYNIEKGNQTSPKADIVVRIAEAFTKYGYDKLEVMSELLERIQSLNKTDKLNILEREKYIEQIKYNSLNKNNEKNDLNYILSSISNDATLDIEIDGTKQEIIIDNNMKKYIKEIIKPMIKLYILK